MCVGIDLGTTYSHVAVLKLSSGGERIVQIVPNDQGNRSTPSYVAFLDSGEKLVGEAAKIESIRNPQNALFDAKRLLGRTFSHPTVQIDIPLWPFKCISGADDKPQLGDEKLTPEETVALVLAQLKQSAEAHLGRSVTEVVLTVPMFFEEPHLEATRHAAALCGLTVLRLEVEPVAAVIAYGLDTGEPKLVLVFKLGGATLEVSVVAVGGGLTPAPIAVCGDRVGGTDFGWVVVAFCCQEFKRKNRGKDLAGNPRSVRRLLAHCEQAVRTLSIAKEATIEIESLFEGIDFACTLTRERFEELNADYFEMCREVVEGVLQQARISKKQVDDVLLVGGSSRIPKIQALLTDLFPDKKISMSINPDEVFALGAAVQAAALTSGGASSCPEDEKKRIEGVEKLPGLVAPDGVRGMEVD